MTVITDQVVGQNKPDMVMWNKLEKVALIIDFSVPLDQNIGKAYGKKVSKYQPLARQMRDMWHLKKVDIMPLSTWNGLVHTKTIEHPKELNLSSNAILWMQKAIILGTVNIYGRSSSRINVNTELTLALRCPVHSAVQPTSV